MLTQSIYTYIFRRDGRFYLYNSLTSLFAEISEDMFEALYNRDYENLPTHIKEDLKKKKVICKESDLYTYYLSQLVKFNATAYSQKEAGIVIVPTTACNFQCPYCFEKNKKTKRMSEDIQNKIVEYIENNKDLEKINLTWYGGEPLLAFDIIKELYHRINGIEGKCIGKHSIITNGLLISDEVIDFINYAHVNSMQVTIDGIKEHHDITRCTKSNKLPTFDKIMDNVDRLLQGCPDLKIKLRVNISRKNQNDFFQMFEYIDKRFNSDRIYAYPGFIREDTPDACSLCYDSMSREMAFELYRDLREKGVNFNFIPKKVNSRGCMMHSLNSFIIGPEGELYKCWNDVGEETKMIGHIYDNKIENDAVYFHMMTETSPFADPKCKECLHFPNCSGGCGWYRSRNIKGNGRFNVCVIQKDPRILEDALLLSLNKENIKYRQKLPLV